DIDFGRNFGKRFIPQQELSAEQAFWLQTSHPNTDQSDISPVKIKAPRELPKASLVNTSLKKLKYHLSMFDTMVKKKITPDDIIEGEWGFEHTKAVFLNEINPFLKTLKDIFNVFDKNILNEIYKDQFDSIKMTRVRSKEHYDSLIAQLNSKSVENTDLKGQIQEKVFVITSLKNDLQKLKGKEIVENAAQIPNATTIAPGMFKLDLDTLDPRIAKNSEPNHSWGSNATDVPSSSSLVNDKLSRLFSGTVRFGNDQIAKIIGYGDYQLGNVNISRVYCVEGLEHNLFSVGQFCDLDLEVAFQKNTFFIQNLDSVDLLSGSRDTNLYTISLDDMLKIYPISKDILARGIPKLKFKKDHLCSACALGKSKKSSHQPKAEDTNQEKLYLLHMDLCGPVRVESISGKKYILVIVVDYLRFTWVKFLRLKDEAPNAIIKCIKNIQVSLNATVLNVRTDNGTEFVNQTLREFYKDVGISHQTFVARTSQQNGGVKRRSRTLVEVARTMLIFLKAPLFL
ncbi:retrovirus-related pol polyprotein from transposon TNT 1-94, partial [Tanacetum coccineum]